MFENKVTMDYTGADATGEIIIMLLVAFILGYLLRWLMNRFWGCEHCSESALEAEMKNAAPAAAAVAPAPAAPTRKVRQDDLKIVEGIGPKIAQLLVSNGINTWDALAKADVSRLKEILESGGDRFRMHDPSTWPEQAMLARDEKWDELDEYQEFLNGGKVR